MAELKQFTAGVFAAADIKRLCSSKPEITYKKIFDNKKLVDTAGFVPLNVRIKQFLVSGEQSKISSEMFDSDDWRYMFNHINENQLEVGDDIEDVARKLMIVQMRQREILARKGLSSDTPDRVSSESETKAASKESVTESKNEKE